MLRFPIPPEDCLIVNAFCQASTLRGAAQLLGTDPAGLVRKVQRISAEHGFLQKVGNRWAVTEAGRRVAQWTDELISSQKKLRDEKPTLRLAAFTWLAEEMLIPGFCRLHEAFGERLSWSLKTIVTDLEQELLLSRTDFVITGHAPNDPAVAHKRISTHPWVVVIPYSWKRSVSRLNEGQLIDFLQTQPFTRHSNVNPEQALDFRPDVICHLMVDGVIGVRSAVACGHGWSVLPAMSVRSFIAEKKILRLSIRTHIQDDVSLWWLRVRKDAAVASKPIVQWISGFRVD